MSGKVLLFHVNVMKAGQIQAFCKNLGIQTVVVPREDYSQKLGVLAGISGMKRSAAPYAGEEFRDEMMAFSGVNSDDLDDFLDDYKAAGISPIARKAVITPYNIMWTPTELYHALGSEIRGNR